MSKSNNVFENPVTLSLQMTSDMLAKTTDMWQNYPAMLTKTCEQYTELSAKYMNFLQQQQTAMIDTYSRMMKEMCDSMNVMANSIQDIQVPAMENGQVPGFMSYFELAKQVEDLSRRLMEMTTAPLKAEAKK
ncbi:MAG: hypothetical protein GXY34_15105 [Syntrophomonadaceae bacterium]|nr:hypothetical protein [Syntrophomonadaceae bacterium]